jgi:hypothetical protein
VSRATKCTLELSETTREMKLPDHWSSLRDTMNQMKAKDEELNPAK